MAASNATLLALGWLQCGVGSLYRAYPDWVSEFALDAFVKNNTNSTGSSVLYAPIPVSDILDGEGGSELRRCLWLDWSIQVGSNIPYFLSLSWLIWARRLTFVWFEVLFVSAVAFVSIGYHSCVSFERAQFQVVPSGLPAWEWRGSECATWVSADLVVSTLSIPVVLLGGMHFNRRLRGWFKPTFLIIVAGVRVILLVVSVPTWAVIAFTSTAGLLAFVVRSAWCFSEPDDAFRLFSKRDGGCADIPGWLFLAGVACAFGAMACFYFATEEHITPETSTSSAASV